MTFKWQVQISKRDNFLPQKIQHKQFFSQNDRFKNAHLKIDRSPWTSTNTCPDNSPKDIFQIRNDTYQNASAIKEI